MFRLDNILENWAAAYKPLAHVVDAQVGKGKSFFRIGAVDANNEFNREFNKCPHAVMAFSTLVDAEMGATNRTVNYGYTIYFMVKQTESRSASLANDDEQAMGCRYEGNDMITDLMVFLMDLRRRCTSRDTTDHSTEEKTDIIGKIAAKMTSEDVMYFCGINLDKAQWGSMPLKFGNWWVNGLQFNGDAPKQLCLTESKYEFK